MKYKLVKEYPESIKLGTIVYLETEDNYMTNMENDFKLFPKKIVENYPEFWEKVVEKDYEILSYIHNGSKHIWKKDSQLKDTFCLEDGKSPFTRLEDILKYPKIYLIHSVKRKDGEIFTIGDKITSSSFSKLTDIDTIKEFYIPDEKFCKMWNNQFTINDLIIRTNVSWQSNLYHAIKSKQPIFQTEDGVDIFDGDKYFICTASLSNCINNEGIVSKFFKPNPNYKYFSTKEKAEEYILMNKPVLSLKEIKETTTIKGLSLKKLEKLVQQKLNK